MKPTAQKPTQLSAWKALTMHHRKIAKIHLRELFADDPKRGERLTAESGQLFLDYSKNRVTDETLKLLVQLAQESGLHERMEAMFRGTPVLGGEGEYWQPKSVCGSPQLSQV